MKPHAKVGLVGAGYVIAVAAAAAAVGCHLIAIGGPARQDYSGMNAFGDSLLFLVVFGVAAVPPTGASCFFLRPYPAFWRVFSVVAPVVALTGFGAFIAVAIEARSMVGGLAFLRILVAPLFTLAFGISGFLAPNRASRIALFAATAMEMAAFACWMITCFVRNA
ncbi:MAG: hypothetical protein WCS43_14180 [Verrucomicrobiota bacterium]